MPPTLEHVPGLDVAGAYRPSGDGSVVGGDFYDLFQVSDDRWVVVLGDVCGKGATAASLTALVRYTVRAESLRNPRPSSVLERVHDAVRSFRPHDFCTALLMTIALSSGRPRLRLSAGGHPLPLHIDGAGRIRPLGRPGALLGLIEGPKREDAQAELRPGESLILFTDGVTEGSRDAMFYGEDRLRALLEQTSTLPAKAVAERVVTDVLEFQDGQARDDIAVVVVKAPSTS